MTPSPDRKDIFSWEQAMLATPLPAPTKLVLMVLRSHSNAMGQMVWPSQERVATLCSMTTRAVRTHIQKAEAAGWLRRVKLSEAQDKIMESTGRKPVKRKSSGRDWAALAYECCFPDGQTATVLPQRNKVPPISGPRPEGGSAQGRNKVPPLLYKDGTPQPEQTNLNPPPPPRPVDNGDNSGEKKIGAKGVVVNAKKGESRFSIVHHLSDKGWAAARKGADGWDIYHLARVYDAGIASGKRDRPAYPDAAFAAWCAKYTKGIKP